eukprot:1498726-Rhodomonas_salina.1
MPVPDMQYRGRRKLVPGVMSHTSSSVCGASGREGERGGGRVGGIAQERDQREERGGGWKGEGEGERGGKREGEG